MQTAKVTDEYTILKRKDGRYAVRAAGRKFINGEEKAKILLEAGLITLSEKKAAPEPEAEPEAEAAEGAEEAAAEGEGEA